MKTRKRNIKKNKKTRNKQYGGEGINEYEKKDFYSYKYDTTLQIYTEAYISELCYEHLKRKSMNPDNYFTKITPFFKKKPVWYVLRNRYRKPHKDNNIYVNYLKAIFNELEKFAKEQLDVEKTPPIPSILPSSVEKTPPLPSTLPSSVKNKPQIPEIVPQTVRKILGKGSYGLVVSPAFPNNGKTFTNNTVSKIFIDEESMKAVVDRLKGIQSKIPLLDIDITEYTQLYKVKNANKNMITYKNKKTSIQNQINSIRESKSTSRFSRIYPVRMPNLGYSCEDINKDVTLSTKMRSIDYKTISMEILKLLCTVRQININNYIHGDVRESNVMCNLDTGKLTIIDFDWFYPIEEFYEYYPVYFYSHPPECVAIFEKNTIEYILDNITELLYRKNYNNYLRTLYKSDVNTTIIFNNIGDKFRECEHKKDTYEICRDKLYKDISDFIDSWGLMLAIYSLIENSWGRDNNKTDESTRLHKYILYTLIPSMLHPDMNKRWDATRGIHEFYGFLDWLIPKFCADYLKENPLVRNELDNYLRNYAIPPDG